MHPCAAGAADGLTLALTLTLTLTLPLPLAQALQSKFGAMQVVGGDGSMPAQPEPRLMLAAFNQQTAGSHVYSFVPRRLVVFGEELRREQLDYVDWNWEDVRSPTRALTLTLT